MAAGGLLSQSNKFHDRADTDLLQDVHSLDIPADLDTAPALDALIGIADQGRAGPVHRFPVQDILKACRPDSCLSGDALQVAVQVPVTGQAIGVVISQQQF